MVEALAAATVNAIAMWATVVLPAMPFVQMNAHTMVIALKEHASAFKAS